MFIHNFTNVYRVRKNTKNTNLHFTQQSSVRLRTYKIRKCNTIRFYHIQIRLFQTMMKLEYVFKKWTHIFIIPVYKHIFKQIKININLLRFLVYYH